MLLKSGGDTTQNKKKKRIFFKWSSTYVILGNVMGSQSRSLQGGLE